MLLPPALLVLVLVLLRQQLLSISGLKPTKDLKVSRSQAFGAQDPQLRGNKYPSQQEEEVSGYPIQNPAH
jgi:hypothetical protein